jgi:mono/diheme cytochrome c family protein
LKCCFFLFVKQKEIRYFENSIFADETMNQKHMRTTKILYVILIPLVLSLFSCTHDPEDTADPIPPDPDPGSCDSTLVTYSGTVVPILQANCFSCHTGQTPSGGLDLSNYDQLAIVAQNGSLLGSIRHESGYSPMPHDLPKLSDCDIALIAKWVSDTTFTDPGGGGGGGGGDQECDPDTVYFQNEILPLLISSCGVIGCHDPGTAEDGVILTDYASIMQTADVRPGDPEGSDLFEAITDDDPEDRMPPLPRQPLTAVQIAKIEKWIQQGAQNNLCETTDCDTLNVTYSGQIFPLIQNSCLGCHSGDSPSGGLLLTNHSQIAEASANGRLMGAIRHETGYSPMPKNGAQLNDCTITQFEKWIENGTPNN